MSKVPSNVHVLELYNFLKSINASPTEPSLRPDGSWHIEADWLTVCHQHLREIHEPLERALFELDCKAGEEVDEAFAKAYDEAVKKLLSPFMPCCMVESSDMSIVTFCVVETLWFGHQEATVEY